jgi:hypothetical protein
MGPSFLYDTFFKDFLKKNESKIDEALNDAKRNASSVGKELVSAFAEISAARMVAASKMAQSD